MGGLQQKDDLEEVEETLKDPEEIKKIGHEIFDKADKDGDGKLTMKEMSKAGPDFEEFGKKYGLRDPTEEEMKEIMKTMPMSKEVLDDIVDTLLVKQEEYEEEEEFEKDPEEIKKVG